VEATDSVAAEIPPSLLASAEPSASTPLFEEAPMMSGLSELQEATLPAAAPSESLFFRPIPYMAPLGASPGSVLSGALQGRPLERQVPTPERPMPPPNRRPASAVPASVAFGNSPAPASSPPWSAGQVSSREIAQLRLEMREELEQIKNDLFGAATGVSALKDRLDGVEQTVTKAAQTSSPRMEELQAWMDERIEKAVLTAVARAFEAALGGGREGAHLAPARPQDRPSLSEAPVVLSSSPS
jgi:hypothetical protein